MKTRRQNTLHFSLALALVLLASASYAQGHRQNDRKGNEHQNVKSYHGSDTRWTYYDRHDRHHPGSLRKSHAHEYRRAPRYVYYRDHNVYYDCERRVYISPSRRGWVVTPGVPAGLRGVHLNSATVVAVDYYGNSLGDYLAHHRPSYIQFQVSW